MDDLCVKAGRRAYEIIRNGGFSLDRIRTYFAPAVGPRWLIASGFDLTLMGKNVLGRSNLVWLVGASAGAWRLAAWLQPEPEKSYRALMEAYTNTTYTRQDTPATVLNSLSGIINSYLEDDALPFALSNTFFRLAVITARGRHLVASENSLVQRIGLAVCFLANALSRSSIHSFAERIVFYNGARPPYFCLKPGFKGRFIPLSSTNFKTAVLASGAIPLVVAGVRDVFGAPKGIYRDGGLIDYNISTDYTEKPEEITLFFHHQERIIPGWLDKRLKKRQPPEGSLDNVLMIYPSENFVSRLPGEKVPDRDDFLTFIDDPASRIRNWQKAVEMSSSFGEQFLNMIESGRIRHLVGKLKSSE